MNRTFILVMALVIPLCANAEEQLTQEQIDAMSERLKADPCAYAGPRRADAENAIGNLKA